MTDMYPKYPQNLNSYIATTQLNPKLGRPYFPKKLQPQPHHKPQTDLHFFSAFTPPNSIKFSMQEYFV